MKYIVSLLSMHDIDIFWGVISKALEGESKSCLKLKHTDILKTG